jgi:hypothetical protein
MQRALHVLGVAVGVCLLLPLGGLLLCLMLVLLLQLVLLLFLLYS